MRPATCLALLGCLVAAGGCLALHDPLNLEGSFYHHQRSFSADLRWGVDHAGEVYIMTQSDGTIRKIVGATFQAMSR